MAARKPTKLNAPATVTAIQLAQNGTSTPFKVTDDPITIRINCRSVIRAKMAAASVQKVLMVIARLRNGEGPGAAATPPKQGGGLTEPFSMCRTIAVSRRRDSGSLPPLAPLRHARLS